MPKFFVSKERILGNLIRLDERNSAHIKVLRLKNGEAITVSDGEGYDYGCEYRGMEGDTAIAEILNKSPCASEPDVFVYLYAAMPKGEKAELILQKAVELGAGEVCFFLSSRCISRPDGAAVKKRMERLQRISEEAAMQSGRGRVPRVSYLPAFSAMTQQASAQELGLFLWEEAREHSLRGILRTWPQKPETVALITGPEGGFSREEAEQAEKRGLIPVTLGKRILRCETAPLCALSAVMYETENLE